MSLAELLKDCSVKGWKFWNEGDKLYFDAPSEESTTEVLAQLKPSKASIVQLLKEQSDVFNVRPLSYDQQAFWLLWQLEPQSSIYNQVFSVRIHSHINAEKMHSAFEAVIERHPCLRSTFPKAGEQVVQQVHQRFDLDWQHIVAEGWSEEQLKASVSQSAQEPYNLEKELPTRARLFTISPKEHILLLTIHHIVTDGWSLDIVLSELSELYQAKVQGTSASLPTLAYDYSDYVNHQNQMLESERGEILFRYWQKQLSGELSPLNLPIDHPRPALKTYNGASVKFRLSRQLTQKLKQLAMSSDATLYMTLLAAFHILLYRHTGTEDILVGSPVAGRSQTQFRDIVGYFINQIVVRGDLSNNPTFQDFLSQVRETVKDALTYQDYPFSLLADKLKERHDPSYSRIFQVSFAFQQVQKSQGIQSLFLEEDLKEDIVWGGLKLSPFYIPQQEGFFDLALEMIEGSVEEGTELKGAFKYNSDLFEPATIQRMVGHFQNLLEAITTSPERKVSQLEILSNRELHQLLVEWNDTKTNYPLDKCVHQLFEEQVEKTPNAIALISSDQKITYQQLNQRANQLAHHLKTLGVTSEQLVGICVERSVDLVVGFLGILKAGGVYVPLDPSYPQERLSYLLNDTSVEVLLTQKQLAHRLPKDSLPNAIKQVVYLDELPAPSSANYLSNPNCSTAPHHLAYIIYTSGSTGQPKGVMIEHLGCVNHCYAMIEHLSLLATDNIAQTAPIGFDISVWQIITSLLVGGSVTIIDQEIIQDPAWLFRELQEKQISILQVVPSLLRAMLDICGSAECLQLSHLKWLLVTGETFPTDLLEGWFQYYPNIPLVNAYGPAECSDDVTLHPIYSA